MGAIGLLLYSWLSRRAVSWTIDVEGVAVGHCHLRGIDRVNGIATGALLIGEKSQRGKGLACEAIALRSEFAFRRLGLHKLKSSTQAKNVASRRMLEKSGYRLIGTAREDVIDADSRDDVLLFELLRADYERRAGEAFG
jgi:RimJ/RimL family protein N-acetyltransferase